MTQQNRHERRASEKSTRQQPRLNLVGCCFHIFSEDNELQYQGAVRGDLGGQYYLVEYLDWIAGEPSKLEIVHISRMCGSIPDKGERWQFYEDNKHMNSWYEYKHRFKK